MDFNEDLLGKELVIMEQTGIAFGVVILNHVTNLLQLKLGEIIEIEVNLPN